MAVDMLSQMLADKMDDLVMQALSSSGFVSQTKFRQEYEGKFEPPIHITSFASQNTYSAPYTDWHINFTPIPRQLSFDTKLMKMYRKRTRQAYRASIGLSDMRGSV